MFEGRSSEPRLQTIRWTKPDTRSSARLTLVDVRIGLTAPSEEEILRKRAHLEDILATLRR